jgi:HD-like signal output (HDOD) protein
MKQQAASQTSTQRSFIGWFRRLFSPQVPVSAVLGTKLAGQAPANTQVTPEAQAGVEGWNDYAPDFAPFAGALALEFRVPVQLTDAQLEEIAQLSAAVREHAEKDDSGPKSLPNASLRILNLVAKNDVEVTELATAIQQDPALTAAILRVANSAALGGAAGPVNTVRDAVVRLGIAESGRVAGAVAAKTLFSAKSKSAHAVFAPLFGDLHVAAATAAAGAAYLAMTRAVGRSDMAYLGGMLHDVGRSLALGSIASMVLERKSSKDLDPEVVQRVLDEVHVDVGAQAHERWGLPQYLTSLCASHHDANVPNHPSQAELHLVRAVSGLICLRATPQPLERIAELSQSIGVLGLTPLQTRALDAELRRTSTRLREALA